MGGGYYDDILIPISRVPQSEPPTKYSGSSMENWGPAKNRAMGVLLSWHTLRSWKSSEARAGIRLTQPSPIST